MQLSHFVLGILTLRFIVALLEIRDGIKSPRVHRSPPQLWALDLILTPIPEESLPKTPLNVIDLSEESFGSMKFELLRDALRAARRSVAKDMAIIIRLFFPAESGYVARCDFLERRFEGCEAVKVAKSFLPPLSSVLAVPQILPSMSSLKPSSVSIVSQAIGGVLLKSTASHELGSILQELDREMENRLSFPWILQQQVKRRRVFWVQGREDFESSRRAYEAAWALGITLVVLDHPGHWLEDDRGPHAHLREAFVPTNIDIDDGFAQRIVNAVQNYPHPVDGITTISDVRLAGVAKACEILGLPTSPSAAYSIAGDKAATRNLEPKDSNDSFAVNSSADLDAVLAHRRGKLVYPLIVKPCTGWNSDCVSKVHDEPSLCAAVARASARHANSPNRSTGVVVEPYIDGPEVDANFVILNGEILFFDITDDFPSTADSSSSNETENDANFMETLMVVPSGLPLNEKEMMRECLRQSILRQGFESGVFHCEARVRHSTARYAPRDDNGLLDLQVSSVTGETNNATAEPSCYLHEVNARPPGYLNTVGVLLAYGVDYYAIRLLFSLGLAGEERVRALSHPFRGDGPQYTLGVTILPARRSGVMDTEDAVEELMDRHPWLRDCIVDHKTCKKRGDVVQGPESAELWWVAYATVASRVGRKDCLEKVQFVKDHFSYKLIGE
ncbi:ATP-grasp superfamily protein [Colletotrichum higginsianum IMI 349063]|uniref:ATP-grasp superfamily protein n=1 Tax=Colletotrichum higginsianum (strain IMI 349063) TaxID=759273 RepID=A0A1B7YMJ1_COLHI|nr:ATP-grasp superfamily protein [Colletotrichum higginsianum IMI 349063]OBR13253.1 ATP-grasp superfamily protein [Colletotrichum higginsianum IMI 349063]